MVQRVQAKRVRYVHLAESWAEECLRSDTLRLDLSTDRFFKFCINQNWDDLARAYRAGGDPISAASRRVDQVRAFFQDDGQTLWVTFHAGRMYWTFIDPRIEPWTAEHGEGSMRRTLPWRSETICGAPLWMSSLPAKWKKAPSAPEIVVELEYGDEIIRRINDKDAAETVRVERLLRELREAVIPLLARMSAEDFAQLVELVFTSGGWRRQSTDAQAKLSELELPSTGERALVRSTPEASQTELDDFRAKFGASTYDRLIFVYPTGVARSTNPRITVIGPEQLGRIVVEMGLLSWLLNRVR